MYSSGCVLVNSNQSRVVVELEIEPLPSHPTQPIPRILTCMLPSNPETNTAVKSTAKLLLLMALVVLGPPLLLAAKTA